MGCLMNLFTQGARVSRHNQLLVTSGNKLLQGPGIKVPVQRSRMACSPTLAGNSEQEMQNESLPESIWDGWVSRAKGMGRFQERKQNCENNA